jgi:hypothetical protein
MLKYWSGETVRLRPVEEAVSWRSATRDVQETSNPLRFSDTPVESAPLKRECTSGAYARQGAGVPLMARATVLKLCAIVVRLTFLNFFGRYRRHYITINESMSRGSQRSAGGPGNWIGNPKARVGADTRVRPVDLTPIQRGRGCSIDPPLSLRSGERGWGKGYIRRRLAWATSKNA